MSKKEVVQDAGVVENEDKIGGSIEALKVQLKEYREKAQYFQTMSTKAEGALEVLMQLSEKKEEPN